MPRLSKPLHAVLLLHCNILFLFESLAPLDNSTDSLQAVCVLLQAVRHVANLHVISAFMIT